MAEAAEAGTRLRHPNQEKASSQATKTVVTLLLVASAALIGVVMVAGWTAQQGARWLTAAHVILYLVMAYYIFRWKRGVLVLAAGLSLLFVIYSAIGLPLWFERTKTGYAETLLPASLLGLLTVVIIVVQSFTIVASMVGFNQGWNLEVEERVDSHDDYEDDEDWEDEDYEHDGDDPGGGGHADAQDGAQQQGGSYPGAAPPERPLGSQPLS